MKTVAIVTPFDNYSYNVRIKYIESYFQKRGYKTLIISSNFDHRNKSRYQNSREGLELINVPEYRRNLSIKRIFSHKEFARKSVIRVNEILPTFVYVSGPPNLLFKYFSKNKRKYSDIKIIYEVGDMWPETMPVNDKIKKICKPVFHLWSAIRDKYLPNGDYIIFECKLFENMLRKKNPLLLGETLYMCKESIQLSAKDFYICDETLEMVYLGSINNIIDIDLIASIVNKVNCRKKVVFNIIGDGEKKDDLISKVRAAGADINYYGIVYDENKKREIFNCCHFAFNIMKTNVCVGMTMKSIDYFEAGLPLINNIQHDTYNLVEKTKCGYNVNHNNIDKIANIISNLSKRDIIDMKLKSRQIFEENFSREVFEKNFDRIISTLQLF